MADHHERTIDRWVARAPARGAVGVIVVGSVARGTAHADSDVDVYEVVRDDRYEAVVTDGPLSYVDREAADYPDGYVDVKVVSPRLLRRAVAEADEPLRASFMGARVAYDETGELAALVRDIVRVDDDHVNIVMRAMLAQASLHGRYFLPHGLLTGDAALGAHAAVHAAYALGRCVLARHRVLFRGQKYLSEQLRSVGEAGAADAINSLCAHPSIGAFSAAVEATVGTVPEPDAALSRFVLDNEWSWFTGTPVPEHR
jgi:hypothetical protein